MRNLMRETISKQNGLTENDRINSAILEVMLRQNILLESIDYKLDKIIKDKELKEELSKAIIEEPKKTTTKKKKAAPKKKEE